MIFITCIFLQSVYAPAESHHVRLLVYIPLSLWWLEIVGLVTSNVVYRCLWVAGWLAGCLSQQLELPNVRIFSADFIEGFYLAIEGLSNLVYMYEN